MDWLTFIIKMVEAFIWPTVVLVPILLFKRQIRGLINRIKEFNYKDLNVSCGHIDNAIESVNGDLVEKKVALAITNDEQDKAAIGAEVKSLEQKRNELLRQRALLTSGLRSKEQGPMVEWVLRSIISLIGVHEVVDEPSNVLEQKIKTLVEEIFANKQPEINGGMLALLYHAGLMDKDFRFNSIGRSYLKNLALEVRGG